MQARRTLSPLGLSLHNHTPFRLDKLARHYHLHHHRRHTPEEEVLVMEGQHQGQG